MKEMYPKTENEFKKQAFEYNISRATPKISKGNEIYSKKEQVSHTLIRRIGNSNEKLNGSDKKRYKNVVNRMRNTLVKKIQEFRVGRNDIGDVKKYFPTVNLINTFALFNIKETKPNS